ncbi:MAG: TetR/AcrR family transcriptional regulator [Cyclobacteriaceae bacterium]
MNDKKHLVLQATLKLITERGFHDTPMSMIAREAGVAAGTIYHYFSSKEELINELYSSLKARMGQALAEGMQEAGNIKERYFRFWINLYQHFIDYPQEFKFLEQYANSPLVDLQVREENVRHYQPIIDFLTEGMRYGVLREMPLMLMLNLVYGHVVSTAKLQLNGELDISDAYLQMAVQSSWDGVRIN